MNNVIKRVWNQNKMVAIEDLKGMTFQNESGGHTFQISGVDDAGNAVALSGSVAGVFLRPDNTDVAITGSASGGVVSVTLLPECYDVPGRFGLTVFMTNNGQKTAVYAAMGTVSRTSSGTVSPGTTSDVVDLINRINAAVATIPASWTGLMADIAPTYSASAVYPVGAYCYYNGDLYRCTTAITTAESWTAGHWTQAVLGQDVSDLKAAFNNRKVNGHALSSDVVVTKSDIGLGNVNNTSDANKPISIAQAVVNAKKVNQPLDIFDQPTNGTNGQILRTKGDGSTEWVDVGLPTDEQTAEAVSAWLDEHPEATTTVQDGSLTYVKFELGELGYITPETFGAVGDDETDDTDAIQLAVNYSIANNKCLLFTKTYKINGKLYLSKGVKVLFVGGCFDVGSFDTETQTGGWVYFDNPTYNILPEWFGAKGDGVTDDTKSIQNCIDSLLNPDVFPIGKTQAEAGYSHTQYNSLCIEFHNKYIISDQIDIRAEAHFNKLTLFSNTGARIIGKNETQQDFVAVGLFIKKPDNYPSGDEDTQTYKYFDGLEFARFGIAIYDQGTDIHSSITNCMFSDCSDTGVLLFGCDGTLFSNNYGCWGIGYLVRLYYSNGCRITENHIGETDYIGQLGIKIENGGNEGNIIANNVLKNCGITITNRKYNSDQIVGNNIFGANIGIKVGSDCTGVLIACNNIRHCTTGIYVYKEVSINNNLIYDCTTGILLLEYGRNNIIEGNFIKSCPTGIDNQKASYYNNYIGNKIMGSSVIGIKAGFPGAGSFAADNVFTDCTAVHSFTSGTNTIQFAYNYSTQQGMVLGSELN